MKQVLYSYLIGLALSWYFAASVRNKPIEIDPPVQFYAEKSPLKLWHGNDSLVMEYVYLATTYLSFGKDQQALVLYKHASTIEHQVPGVFLSTGTLYLQLGDTLNANRFFEKEIEHGTRLIDTNPFRETQFATALYDAYSFLKDFKNADKINRRYRLKREYNYLSH